MVINYAKRILHSGSVRVYPQTHQSFLDGFARYSDRQDKGYSLTDCVSMHIMKREGISEILTSDIHFEQESFVRLLKKK